MSGWRGAWLVAALVLLAACGGATREGAPGQQREPTPPERTDIPKIARPIAPHEAVPGSTARTALLFAHAIPGMNARVEVREYYVSEGAELVVPMPSETTLEIRSGQFDVQARDVKGEPVRGTIWAVQSKERVVVRATSQLAVLRAVSIIRQ